LVLVLVGGSSRVLGWDVSVLLVLLSLVEVRNSISDSIIVYMGANPAWFVGGIAKAFSKCTEPSLLCTLQNLVSIEFFPDQEGTSRNALFLCS
jgi:hypothetical protein